MTGTQAIEILQRRRDRLNVQLVALRDSKKSTQSSFIRAEIAAIKFFINGEDRHTIKQLRDTIDTLRTELTEQSETARRQTQEAFVARQTLRKMGVEL